MIKSEGVPEVVSKTFAGQKRLVLLIPINPDK